MSPYAGLVGRPGDLVARYHRDEFALVLASTDGPGSFKISEQVRAAVRDLNLPAAKDAPDDFVTASVATSTATPQRESAWEELDLIKAFLVELPGGFMVEHDFPNLIKPHGRHAWSIHLGGGPYLVEQSYPLAA